MDDERPAAPVHVVGESRIREAHAMCAGCGLVPVKKPGDRCEDCSPPDGYFNYDPPAGEP
jgi:hypothetical protein